MLEVQFFVMVDKIFINRHEVQYLDARNLALHWKFNNDAFYGWRVLPLNEELLHEKGLQTLARVPTAYYRTSMLGAF